MALSNREERDRQADLRAQEIAVPGAGAPMTHRTANGFIRATSPAGDPVTFVPGEGLPKWAVERLDAGGATYDADTGAWTLPAGKA